MKHYKNLTNCLVNHYKTGIVFIIKSNLFLKYYAWQNCSLGVKWQSLAISYIVGKDILYVGVGSSKHYSGTMHEI